MASSPLDLDNVQGDILLGGLPKKTETFFFFQIDKNHVHDFRTQLVHFAPLVTSTAQAVKDQQQIADHKSKVGDGLLLKLSGVNIAFTQKGLAVLGIDNDIGDSAFHAGQLAGASKLGDKTADWMHAFKQDIHGVILITGESHATVDEKLADIEKIFRVDTPSASIHKIFKVVGDVRPGKEKGHEHFGFLDGVSQPAVKNVDKVVNDGQETIRQGIILLGRDGDTITRPTWALDGSFLAFRYLSQLVPEFDAFKKSIATPDLDEELLGARMMGRWKSGAPIDVTPTVDDQALGADPTRNNDFSFNAVFPNDQHTQDRCPFAAHVRKTNPRADLESIGISTETRRIIRSGIQFGPELSKEEIRTGKTTQDRGLLFVCYQSNIPNGFQFIQQGWANNVGFPIQKGFNPGFDPIIGQAPDEGVRIMTGVNPKSPATETKLPTQWVLPKGGEYFFSPSIPALKHTFALAA